MVNNAGVSGVGGPLDFLSKKDFVDVFNVNVFGMAEVTRTFLPLLKRSRGRIVNTTSMAGLLAVPSDKPYTASKFAAEGLSDALRFEASTVDLYIVARIYVSINTMRITMLLSRIFHFKS